MALQGCLPIFKLCEVEVLLYQYLQSTSCEDSSRMAVDGQLETYCLTFFKMLE